MIDYQELKRLAEAATPGEWQHECDDLFFKDPDGYTRHLMETCEGQDIAIGHDSNLKFIAAANPSAVLELLGEIELLSKNPVAQAVDALATAAARHLATEAKGCLEKGLLETIDKLKAEVEDLRKDAERFRYLRDKCQNISIGDGGKFDFPDFAGISFSWRRREWINGKPFVALELNQAIDAAMSKESEQ